MRGSLTALSNVFDDSQAVRHHKRRDNVYTSVYYYCSLLIAFSCRSSGRKKKKEEEEEEEAKVDEVGLFIPVVGRGRIVLLLFFPVAQETKDFPLTSVRKL